MKFFGKKTTSEDSKDILDNSFSDSYANGDLAQDKATLISELERIRNQIDAAKEEHEEILSQLMPAKWELLDKKDQISHIKSEYEEISSRLVQARAELDEIMRKLDKSKSDVNYKST